MTMEVLDRVFEVVFARYRRRLGDSGLESAWRRASNTVVGYASWTVVTVALLVLMMINSMMALPTPQKRSFQVTAVVAGLVAGLMLDRRFRKYLLAPHALSSAESPADTQLVFRFRFISVGIFVLTCLVGFLLHRAGFKLG